MYDDIRLAFIYGDKLIDKGNYDGIIETLYINDEASHIEYMISFFRTHFKEDEYLQQNLDNWTATQVALYLKEIGHITFFNQTSYRNDAPRSGKKEGLLILPDVLTEKQIVALENFKVNIRDYHTLQIWQNFYRDDDGMLNCTNITNENTTVSSTDLIDVIIKKNSTKVK